MQNTQDVFSLIGDALLALTEAQVHRDNENTARADDCLVSAINMLVEARDLLRPPVSSVLS